MVNIAINGLGRIGRAIIRAKLENHYPNINIVAANGPANIEDHAHLIKYDSVHGRFNKDIYINDDILIIDDQKIKITHQKDPLDIDYGNADIVLECSGKFNKADESRKHLKNNVKKVIVSAPCENADNTIIYGVNNQKLIKSDQIISIGSCTTNAFAPIAKILNDNIGIDHGYMTTIHSYTNDQNLTDASHKDIRRARAALLSIIPTSTGAAKTIDLIIPELKGKLSGSALRVPTSNVSLIDFTFTAKKSTTKDEINNMMISAASNEYNSILAVTKEKLVSIDFNHTSFSSIFDPFETNLIGDKLCRIVSWYDNEWGFANRMLDIVNLVSKYL